MGHVDLHLQVGNNSSLCRLGPGFMRRVRHFGDLEMAIYQGYFKENIITNRSGLLPHRQLWRVTRWRLRRVLLYCHFYLNDYIFLAM